MKLTPRQVMLRSTFRKMMITAWHRNLVPMHLVLHQVCHELQTPEEEMIKELEEIPSIGYIGFNLTVHVWFARYYRSLSTALLNGTPDSTILVMWKTAKRTVPPPPVKRSKKDAAEYHKTLKTFKYLRELNEISKTITDRAVKNTRWDRVK